MQGAAKEIGGALLGHAEGEEAHRDGAAHDEGERRVPGAGQVQEADHLAGVGHAGNHQAPAEEKADGEFGCALQVGVFHGDVLRGCVHRTHSKCLITKTMAKPAAMKVPVATIERGDRRDSPHTPWPLVQPELRRVP